MLRWYMHTLLPTLFWSCVSLLFCSRISIEEMASKQLQANIQLYVVSTGLLYMQSREARAVAQLTLWHSIWHRLLAHTCILYLQSDVSICHNTGCSCCLYAREKGLYIIGKQLSPNRCQNRIVRNLRQLIVWSCSVAANLCNKCVQSQGLCFVVVHLFQHMPLSLLNFEMVNNVGSWCAWYTKRNVLT